MPYKFVEEQKPKYRFVEVEDQAATTPAGTRYLQGLKDPFDGGAQLLSKILPDSVSGAIDSANNFIANKTGLLPKIPQGGVSELIKQQQKNYVAPEGVDWARLGGNITSPANLAIASKVPQGAAIGSRMLSGAGVGASMGALTPVSGDGDFATEKAKQIAISAGMGGVLPAVTGGVSRLVSPKASVNPKVDLLRKQGVNPTVGQAAGGWANNFEEKLSSLPVVGNGIARARNSANTQFEQATYNQVLAPIGKTLPKDLKGREALQFAETALKDKYDDVLTKIGAITPDEQFNANVNNLQKMVDDLVMPKAEKMKFANALNDVKQSIDKNGVITSDGYKKLESVLGTKARKLAASQDIYDGDMAPAVKQLQQELRDMLKRQAGGFADELQQANSAWAKFKRVQDAAGKLGADEGSFTPSQFQNAVRSMDKSKDKAAFARGGALMQDLGDAGKSVLGNKVPNSGTADRALMTGAGIYSFLDPTVGLPLLAGASLYTNPAQKLLTGSIANRPQSAQAIAEAVKRSSPYFTPAFAGLLQ